MIDIKTKRHYLAPAEKFALSKWISENEQILRSEELTRNQIAEAASVALEFTINGAHIRYAERTLGITFSTRAKNDEPENSDVAYVAYYLVALMKDLGHEPPARLITLSEQ